MKFNLRIITFFYIDIINFCTAQKLGKKCEIKLVCWKEITSKFSQEGESKEKANEDTPKPDETAAETPKPDEPEPEPQKETKEEPAQEESKEDKPQLEVCVSSSFIFER